MKIKPTLSRVLGQYYAGQKTYSRESVSLLVDEIKRLQNKIVNWYEDDDPTRPYDIILSLEANKIIKGW